MPNVHFSFRRGAGDVPEILYGKVEIKPTLAFARGTSLVLPAPTTLDLVNGEATANNVYPTPAPVAGQVEWAYRVKTIDTRGQTFEWMVGVPDSTGTVEFTTLPRYFETKPPLFGEGPKGEPGEAATVAIGIVSSGSVPEVTNTGTNKDAVLDFVLPKGDKGDKGDGVPAGGTALQYVRKDSAGTGTEWATLTKSSVGLGNVDNTSDANKPVSTATQAAIDNKGLLAYQSKTFSDAPSTYPKGESNGLFRVSAGWPELTINAQFAHVITYVHSLNYGGTVQYMYPYSSAPSANYAYRVADASGAWGELRYGVTEDKISGYRATERNTFAGLYSGQNNDGMYPLDPNVNGGYELVGIGRGALQMNQRGWKNTAIGYDAMRDNIDGYMNVAVGNSALERTTGGIGMGTPTGNAPGSRNTAVGSNAGRYNTTGKQNTYIGRDAGHSALTGDGNTAVGAYAWTGIVDGDIHSAKTGNYNTALGYGAGYFNDSDYNVAVGYMSLEQSVGKDAYGNVAVGSQALRNSEARENTGLGNEAGRNVTVGRFSIAIGPRALGANSTAVTGNSNISIGAASSPAMESGAFNIALGQEALTPITTGSGNVAIGHRATISAAATISYGVAVGYQANAGHNRAVALGSSASTTSADQVQFGNRHMELTPITAPAAPTGAVRLYYVTVGGKGQLRARFPTGAEQVISQEP